MSKDSISVSKMAGLVAIVATLGSGFVYIGSKPNSGDVDAKIQKLETRSRAECKEIRKEFHEEIKQINTKISNLRSEIRSDLNEFRKDLRAILQGGKK